MMRVSVRSGVISTSRMPVSVFASGMWKRAPLEVVESDLAYVQVAELADPDA